MNQNLDNFKKILSEFMYILLFISIIAQLLSGASSGYIWYLRSLQMIVHLPMMSTILPANVQAYFESLIPIVQFDLLEAVDAFNLNNFVDFDMEIHEKMEWKLLD